MEIRKDFTSVTQELERLLQFQKVFQENNVIKWSHLKNKEDFEKIFMLPNEQKSIFEKLYSVGRDCAVAMSSKLESFNFPDQHLTLTDFIHSFNGWTNEIDKLKLVSDTAKTVCSQLSQCPWSITEMIKLFDSQLNVLRAVNQTLDLLKQSDLYKKENGLMSEKQNNDVHSTTHINITNSQLGDNTQIVGINSGILHSEKTSTDNSDIKASFLSKPQWAGVGVIVAILISLFEYLTKSN